MWIGAVPALALFLLPVTLLAGPHVAFDVSVVLVPAVAGWAAFCLCRYLTRSFWPSFLGGLMFGCSSFMVDHTQEAHVGLASAAAAVPLVALITLRFLNDELGARGYVLRLA